MKMKIILSMIRGSLSILTPQKSGYNQDDDDNNDDKINILSRICGSSILTKKGKIIRMTMAIMIMVK